MPPTPDAPQGNLQAHETTAYLKSPIIFFAAGVAIGIISTLIYISINPAPSNIVATTAEPRSDEECSAAYMYKVDYVTVMLAADGYEVIARGLFYSPKFNMCAGAILMKKNEQTSDWVFNVATNETLSVEDRDAIMREFNSRGMEASSTEAVVTE